MGLGESRSLVSSWGIPYAFTSAGGSALKVSLITPFILPLQKGKMPMGCSRQSHEVNKLAIGKSRANKGHVLHPKKLLVSAIPNAAIIKATDKGLIQNLSEVACRTFSTLTRAETRIRALQRTVFLKVSAAAGFEGGHGHPVLSSLEGTALWSRVCDEGCVLRL